MKPVKTMQKYKCDFCNKRSTKSVIAIHEKRCFRNPDRHCDLCNDKGFTEAYEGGQPCKFPCPYCSSFDKEKLRQIEERENKNKEDLI